ncbi:hypothetical protein HPB48_005653 [Haemaphysalis longicornis]|uniref:Uncharacterized protein n=1 Tax=Haemaphysalis longicornis TaxID=44386 RepID=A0A9J6G8F8_HAELO|nr:hypothetical protein HPB48_005653 [Haemaphysalis longicornis]
MAEKSQIHDRGYHPITRAHNRTAAGTAERRKSSSPEAVKTARRGNGLTRMVKKERNKERGRESAESRSREQLHPPQPGVRALFSQGSLRRVTKHAFFSAVAQDAAHTHIQHLLFTRQGNTASAGAAQRK